MVPVPQQLRWIGGGSGAGKTTISTILARELGLRVYSTDEAIARHAVAPGPDTPLLGRFLEMGMDDRWLRRDAATMLRTFPWYAGERFDLVVADLRASAASPTLVEGFRLLPHLVHPLLDEPWHAVWLIPTPEFRRAAFAGRAPEQQFWLRTSDPAGALQRLLDRDRMFTEVIERQAVERGLRVIHVDGGRSPSELAADVAGWFRLAPPHAHRLRTPEQPQPPAGTRPPDAPRPARPPGR